MRHDRSAQAGRAAHATAPCGDLAYPAAPGPAVLPRWPAPPDHQATPGRAATMPADFAPFHRYLEFMSPLSGQRANELVQFIASRINGTVVDVGCGWAALLIRLLEANGQLHGIGLDLNDASFQHAMETAGRRGVADRLQLVAGDAKAHLPVSAQGAICIGASQVWGQPAEAPMPLDYAAALLALRKLVVVGAPVVYGEAIWRSAPTQAAAAPLAGLLDEYVSTARAAGSRLAQRLCSRSGSRGEPG